MALNKYMHPRNKYRNKKANFQHLAIKYPEFRKHVFPDVSGKLFLDFQNPESLRQLSITLMKEDFGLDVELPPDRLVPTIPLRLNYILWIEDILNNSKANGEIRGIDIGTGGSCVYPLLSNSLNKWSFLATEVDDLNFTYAIKNIKKNNMGDFIQVKKVQESAILLDVIGDGADTYDFCMCNPPFFSDHLEAQGITNSRSDQRPEPHSVNTASSTESVAFGGEVEFVKKMIHESTKLKDKVRVYTSMVGKKSSLTPLKEELRKLKIQNFSTTEFCQGKTMRWGLGWSFDESVKFPKSVFKEKQKDKRPPLSFLVPENVPLLMYTVEGIAYQIKEYFKELQIKCEEKSSNETKIAMVITACQNTWSNQRRKRRQGKQKQPQEEPMERDENKNRVKMCDTDYGRSVKDNVSSSNISISHKRKHSADLDEFDNKSPAEILETDKDRKLSISKCTVETDLQIEEKQKQQHEKPAEGNENKNKVKMSDSDCGSSLQDHKRKLSADLDEIDLKNPSKFLKTDEDGKFSKSDSTCSDVIKTCAQQIEGNDGYIFTCSVSVKQIEDEQIVIEMSWIDGKIREAMNQVLQYLKNKLRSSD